MSKYGSKNNNSGSSVTPTILEQGDIFFFYRPKVRSEKVESIGIKRCGSIEVYQFGYRAISESIPSKPTFQQILNDVKIRKENLERSYK